MTPEQRLDRLERIARLMVRAGLRARQTVSQTVREQDTKINIIVDAQIKNDERFAKLAEAQIELAQSQAHSDRRLDALIDIIREGHNGRPQ